MRRVGIARARIGTGQGPAIHKPDGWISSHNHDWTATRSIDALGMKRCEPARLEGI